MRRRGMLTAALISILIISMLTPIISMAALAQEKEPVESALIDIRLDGPDIVGCGVETAFSLAVSYPYMERIQNYSYTATIEDSALGAAVTPSNGSSRDGFFQLKIKGSSSPGTMKIKINATAVEPGNAWIPTTWYRVSEIELKVVSPIYVEAVLVNNGVASVNDVSVQMLIDGVLKQTERYNISANTTINLNFSWVEASLTEGKHVVTLIVNDPGNIVDFSTGDNVLNIDVYYSASGDILRGVLAIMIVFVAIVLVLTILQKKPGAKGK